MYFKIIVILLSLQSLSYGYIDSDFDGVRDTRDKCPNTPFSNLVNKEGCSIQQLSISQKITNLSLLFGANYANYHSEQGNKTKTLSQSLELDYEVDRIKVMLYISHFNSKNTPLSSYDDSSFNDTRLSLLYTLEQKIPNLQISMGVGLALPNYDGAMNNNGLDFFYSLNSSYFLGKTSLFANYTFTKIGDDDLDYLSYQNTHALSFGAGYSFSPKLYSSLSLYASDSIVKSASSILNISCFTYYDINQKYFSTFSFSHGLKSAVVDNSYGAQLGYRL